MPEKPPAEPSLRERNRVATEQRVVDATAAITRETGEVSFSMPQVAQRSGVALRTLYRYFPTRQHLVDALAQVADQVQAAPPPETLADLQTWLTTAWKNLLHEEALLRAQHMGPAGAAIRATRARQHRAATDRLLQHLRPDLAPAKRTDLVEQTLLLGSSTALFEFVDVIGVSVDRGAELAAGAIRTLIESA